jgi:hypothetical protein
MNLPITVTLRRKDYREASDAGLLIWRENFIIFLPFFAVPFWICAFTLRILPGDKWYLSWLILWFLKPLFDRLILHVISVRFFEDGASMKKLLRGLGKTLLRGLSGDLLWRRFSPLRSAMMPVRVLESGKKNVKRRELLKANGLNYCFFLTIWGIALEITLLVGEILFFIVMTEIIQKGFLSSYSDFFANAELFIFTAWCFNYMLVETIYVCMGFSLYINSRIEVEGWDIELMFRNFAKKLKEKSINGSAGIKLNGLLIFFCLVCLFFPVKSFASPSAAEGEAPVEILQNILNSPDFGGERDTWGIRLKKPIQYREPAGPSMEKVRWVLAFILRLILISLIIGIIVFLYLYLRRTIYKTKSTAKNFSLKALENYPAETPEALLEKAENYFLQGNYRLAWGYCTASLIVSWSFYRGFLFPPNATEIDCVNLVCSVPSFNSEAQVFNRLINHWVNFAYAGRLPPADSFSEAVSFCKSLRDMNE